MCPGFDLTKITMHFSHLIHRSENCKMQDKEKNDMQKIGRFHSTFENNLLL